MHALLALDQQITSFIYSLLPHTHILDLFFGFLSLQGSSIIIWLIPLGYLFIVEEMQDHRFALFFLGTLSTVYVISDILLKNIIQRPRPDAFAIAANICPPTYSFPSSHAALAFAAALLLSRFDRKRWGFYYVIAVLIAGSRIYLQCHYVLDVVSGALIGSFIAWVILSFYIEASYTKKKKG